MPTSIDRRDNPATQPTLATPAPHRAGVAVLSVSFAIALSLAGCGSGPKTVGPDVPKIGPHGGPAYPLGDKGFAEVLIEPPDGGPGARGNTSLVLAVYLLQPDLKTALASTGLDLSATIKSPESGSSTPVALTPKPAKSGPAASARYASEPGSYTSDEFEGELKVNLDGQSFMKTFHLR